MAGQGAIPTFSTRGRSADLEITFAASSPAAISPDRTARHLQQLSRLSLRRAGINGTDTVSHQFNLFEQLHTNRRERRCGETARLEAANRKTCDYTCAQPSFARSVPALWTIHLLEI